MSRTINISDSLSFHPTSYSDNGFGSSYSTGVTNACASTSNSSNYARFTLRNTSYSIYYDFSISGIPNNATITSVACAIKGYVSRSSNYPSIRLYSGTTAKGSSTTITSTSSGNITNLTTTGTWTVSELSSAKLYIKCEAASTNQNRYFYLYGADLTITYSISGTEYEITSTLATDAVDSIDPAGQTYVTEGNDYELSIYADSIDNFKVEDDGIDVTNLLVRHTSQSGNFTFTGIPTSFDDTNSIYDTTEETNGIYNNNYISNGLTDHNSSTRAAIYAVKGNDADTYIYYNFDCSSIPNNATITSVSCQVKAGNQGTNYYSSNYRQVQLCSGTTTKGTSQNITGSNSSPTIVTVDGGSLWTREELNDIKIRYWVRRGDSETTTGATISFYGATLTINYTITPENPYYWTYTLTNVQTDHTIIIGDAIIEIPEEDPAKTYYPITISGINCTTTPSKGTNRVEAGTSQTITIYPTESQVTLITDNGVDVSSQLVSHGGTIPDPTVSTASGASYGFTLNSSTGYYVSQNTGRASSAAVCRISFDLPVSCLVTIQYINYAEATYDFGIFGNIDTALGTTYSTDSNAYKVCSQQTDNISSVQTLTYEISAGEHFIDIKYKKDSSQNSNNDNLQFKISSIQELEANNNYYTYTLSNISQEHSLIFIFGNVTYYFVNSSVNGEAILYPNGSMVALPGDNYNLTIVPKVADGTLMLTDNNVDRTSQIQTKTTTITKDGQNVTVTNYIYSLTNVQATHNISVTYSTQSTYEIRQVVNSSDLTISPSGTQEVDAGDNYSVNITVTKPGTITVNDSILGDTEYDVTVSDVSGGSKTVTHTLTNIRVSKTLTFDFTELTKYNVTASENSSYLSIPSGYASQSVYSGQSCSVKFASTAPGTITVTDNGTNTNYTVTANGTITHTISSITAAHTVSATFAIATYNITTSLKSGSKSVTINPASSSVDYNGSYTVTLTPSVPGTLTIAEGSTTLQTWTIPVGNLAAKIYTVNNVTAAHTYTVNLTELTKYTVSASENSAYLSIPSGYTSQSIYSGQSCDVKFTSTAPGTITVTDNGTNTNYPVTANGTITHTISSVAAAHTVTATFAIASYQVSASVASGSSSVTLNPSTAQSINYGSAYTLNITPSVPGTLTIKEGNTTVQTYTINVGDLSAKTFTVNNITAAHTYTVTLTELTKYNVTASESSEYLSIPSGYASQSIYSGQSCDVKFASTAPGTIRVSDNGTNTNYTVSANGTITHTISSVTAAHTVSATFTIASYAITTSLKSGSKSVTINPASSSVNYNGSYTVTLTPSVPGTLTISEGSTTLQTWTIPVGNLAAKTYTVNNVTAAHTYTVNLTELTKYTVSASENSEYLSIPSGYASQSIYSGQSCDVKFTATIPGTLTVTDNGNNSSYQVTASNQTITHTISSVTAAHTVTATFSTITYNVSASVKSGSASVTLNPSGTQSIGHGGTYNLSMTPSVPGTLTISEASTTLQTWTIPVGNLAAKTYTVENITSVHTYTVNLTELTKYTVTASESSEYLSIPSGYASQSVYSGQSCSVKFTSTTPGTITVTDNGTNTNYTVTANGTITHTISSVAAAHTVTATFAIATYSVSASSSVTGVTLTPASQTINHGGSASITVKSTNPGTVVINDKITDNGTDSSYTISAANGTATHTISSVTAAHTITVKSFTLAKYTVTATKGSGVTTVSPASQSLDYGSSVSLNVTPTVPGTLYIKETNLPYDAEIEYIKSTGTQRIFFDDYIANPNTEYYLTLKFDNIASNWSSADKGVYAAVNTGGDTDCSFSVNFGGSTSQTTTLFWWTNKTYQSGSAVKQKNYGSTVLSNKNTIHYTNGNINYGGTNFAVLTKTTTNGQGFTLFGTGSTTPFSAYDMYVYNFKLIENSIIIHDYIPVRVGTVGYLYDKVTRRLFGNAGTGSFTLGPDVDTSGTLTIYEQEISPSEAGTSITCSDIYTNLSANHSVTASVLGLDQHTITVTNNSSSILSYTPASPISIYDGETLTINFVPTQPGTLTVTDSVSSSNNQTYTISASDVNKTKVYTITNVTADRTITANLTIASYTVTASSSVTGVTLTPASQTITHNGNATITIKSTNPGTVVITDNGTDSSYTISTANGMTTHTISSVTAAHTVTVKSFTIAKYNVITNLKSGSKSITINPSTTQQVNYNGSYTVTLTPSVPGTLTISEGSTTLQTWTIPVGNLAAKTYTANNIKAAHTYTANLTELAKYNVSVTNNSSTYLTVTPSSAQSIYSGQNATIQIKTTKPGTVSITDNVTGNTSYLEYSNSELNTNKSFTLENVTAAHTLTISLAAQTYPVSVSTSSEYITITSQTPVNIADGSNYQVTAKASIPGTVTLKEGNTTINSANVASPNGTYSYNVTNITAQRTFTLLFTPTNYTVSASVSSGSDVTIISGASYSGIYGTQYTLTFRSGSIGTVSVNDSGTVTTYVISPDKVNQTQTYQKTVTGNSTITLSNSVDTYDITGTIASGSSAYLKYVDNGTDKTSISKTVNAGSNYVLNIKSTHPGTLSLTVNGETSNITFNDSYTYPYTYTYEINNILNDVTVSSSFAVLTFDIQDNGSTVDNIVYGQSYTYTFTPTAAGTYNLYDNDSLIETYNITAAQVGIAKSYTINRVISPHNFRISSTISTYTITVTNNAQTYISNINISNRNPEYNGSSVITIYPRLKGTINITDNNGTPVTISTTGIQKEYTLQNITGDHTIVITFTPGTYTATLTNNIPSTYNYTLSKNSGNYSVTGCETFSFTLSANQTGSSKTTMNGKVIVARTISGSTIRKTYSIIKDTAFSATYEVDDVVNDMTITLTFEETQEAPSNGDRFLKPFNTDSEAQTYISNNNPNPFISYRRNSKTVDYTSHLGKMRMTTQIYRDGNGHKLFERE